MKNKFRVKLGAATFCALVGWGLAWLRLGDPLVHFGYDFSFVFNPNKPPHDSVIIEMNEKSYRDLNQKWGAPWDRSLHARLLGRLTEDKARIVIFDVKFFDASTDKADQSFADAIRLNGKVVLASGLESNDARNVAGSDVTEPLPVFATNANALGLAQAGVDVNAVWREHYPGIEDYPSLPWAAASVLQAPVTLQEERLKDRWINYYGPAGSLSKISYVDALGTSNGYFRDLIVWIGGKPKTGFGGDELDEFSTPFTRWDGRISGGMEILATTLLNLIRGDWLRRPPGWLESFLILISGAALGLGLSSLRPLKSLLIGAAVALAVFCVSCISVWRWHTWFAWPVIALFQVPVAFGVSLVTNGTVIRLERRQKILFLAANPTNETRLALDEECREIEMRIEAASNRDSLELLTKWAVRPKDLTRYLLRHKPHIVHFSGHGSESDEIMLVDDNGEAKPVSTVALKHLLTSLKDNIRVVVLNACFSQPQAEAITEVIDCAVGMKQEIGDEAAIAFAAAFYEAIGFGRSVKVAFDLGRTALLANGIPEEDTPVLLVRAGVDPDKIILASQDNLKTSR